MATVTTPLPMSDPSTRLLTAADLAALPSELPTGTVLYELDEGRLVIMNPPGDTHGAVELNIGAELKIQGEKRGLGKARSGDVGVILWHHPARVVGSDAVFVASARLPLRISPEGYLDTIPDLVVEVRSKNDSQPAVERKINDYLRAGVRVAWVADPAVQTITVYRPGQDPQPLLADDVLTIEDVIPGFRLTVRDAFVI